MTAICAGWQDELLSLNGAAGARRVDSPLISTIALCTYSKHGDWAPRSTSGEEADDELIDAFAIASRALVAIAARSLAGLSGVDIDVAPYRALIILLPTEGPQRVMDLVRAV